MLIALLITDVIILAMLAYVIRLVHGMRENIALDLDTFQLMIKQRISAFLEVFKKVKS